ncbi:MAG: indolepyruvate oxidoreductase subunit beta [Synergistaceae bacterium]|nr:indolepyruvate oxidoreductase subunit beta [Synergistaceae bacterium]
MTNCLIAGVGGQGTVLASRLIASAALERGLDVRGCETIGMAQRGGSVLSHVRLGNNIASPLISPKGADVILAFEVCEGARALRYLKPDGLMIACDRSIQPAGASGGGYNSDDMLMFIRSRTTRLHVLSADIINGRCGARSINVAILGAAVACGAFPFSMEDMEKIIEARFNEVYANMNKIALRLGERLALGR